MEWLTCKVSIKIAQEETMAFTLCQTNNFEKLDREWKLVHAPSSNFY